MRAGLRVVLKGNVERTAGEHFALILDVHTSGYPGIATVTA
jgi:hypothetical protein